MIKITSGSVMGRSHIRLGINNQDACAYHVSEDGFVAVVCDGCGSGMFSEVGATVGSKIVANMLKDFARIYMLNSYHEPHLLTNIGTFKERIVSELYKIKTQLTSFISDIAFRMGDDDFVKTITDHFLFTIVGAISAGPFGAIFSMGDGCYALNGTLVTIPSCENNSPPYLAYNVIPAYVKDDVLSESHDFKIHEVFDIRELESLMLGTDGVLDIEVSSEKKIPGKNELVGSVSQFWANDLYIRNSAAITRRLVQIGREHSRVKSGWLQSEKGHLSDDTTLVLVRQIKDENISEG